MEKCVLRELFLDELPAFILVKLVENFLFMVSERLRIAGLENTRGCILSVTNIAI
jgi:hypothetical protein